MGSVTLDSLPDDLGHAIVASCGVHAPTMCCVNHRWCILGVGHVPIEVLRARTFVRTATDEDYLAGFDDRALCRLSEVLAERSASLDPAKSDAFEERYRRVLQDELDLRFFEHAAGCSPCRDFLVRDGPDDGQELAVAALRRLMHAGANPNREQHWSSPGGTCVHKTPFVAAAESLQNRVVSFLAEQPGVDVHFVSCRGNNAYACVSEDMKVWALTPQLHATVPHRLREYEATLQLLCRLGVDAAEYI